MVELTGMSFAGLVWFVIIGLAVTNIWLFSAYLSDRRKNKKEAEEQQ